MLSTTAGSTSNSTGMVRESLGRSLQRLTSDADPACPPNLACLDLSYATPLLNDVEVDRLAAALTFPSTSSSRSSSSSSLCSLASSTASIALPDTNARHLKRLNLRKSLRPTLSLDYNVRTIAGIIATHPSLEVIDLSENNLNDEHATVIAEAMKSNTNLKVLHLGLNDISAKGSQALAKALFNNNQSLEELYLSHNRVGAEGCRAFAMALASPLSMCQLKTLELSGNGVGSKGAVHLAHGLASNSCTSLKSLWLANNNIGDEGCRSIAKALKHNRSLSWLNLNFNEITDVGAEALDTSIKHLNYSLEALECYNHKVDTEQWGTSIDRHCGQNRNLRKVFDQLDRYVEEVPLALWPKALEAVETKPDLLFLLLKENPDFFLQHSTR